ncbi:uncharacterized protein LOC128852958 [Cuculus canorus]|uniref:uncharacterized protein LOC128852958 n=1 Tax=Cuculus canorus TaxID=55661 RepID=UPI0023AA4172|nr:uncharacterized protein LOC128852958 [Cuculus canorus]
MALGFAPAPGWGGVSGAVRALRAVRGRGERSELRRGPRCSHGGARSGAAAAAAAAPDAAVAPFGCHPVAKRFAALRRADHVTSGEGQGVRQWESGTTTPPPGTLTTPRDVSPPPAVPLSSAPPTQPGARASLLPSRLELSSRPRGCLRVSSCSRAVLALLVVSAPPRAPRCSRAPSRPPRAPLLSSRSFAVLALLCCPRAPSLLCAPSSPLTLRSPLPLSSPRAPSLPCAPSAPLATFLPLQRYGGPVVSRCGAGEKGPVAHPWRWGGCGSAPSGPRGGGELAGAVAKLRKERAGSSPAPSSRLQPWGPGAEAQDSVGRVEAKGSYVGQQLLCHEMGKSCFEASRQLRKHQTFMRSAQLK